MTQAAALRRAADREWRRRQRARTAELLAMFTLAALANGHAPQLKFTTDTARWILALCSRRAGKTSGIAARKAVASLGKPDGNRVYIGLTKDQAREIMWEPIWQPMCATWKLPVEHDETRMVTYFENGSKVRFTGTDDVRHIETELGSALDEATIDECFPAGTLVDGRRIEDYAAGDFVSCVDHSTGRLILDRVVRTFTKTVTTGLVYVRLSSSGFTSTATHPVFAKGRGYVHAEDLREGDLCCLWNGRRMVQGERDQANVLTSMPGPVAGQAKYRAQDAGLVRRMETPGISDQEPNAQEVHSREGLGDAQAHQAQAASTWGQWARSDEGRTGVGNSSWLANGRGCQDEQGRMAREVGIPDLVQIGCGGRVVDDLYRGRWSEPRGYDSQSAGREEDGALEWTRVESVSRVEPRSAGGTAVYNLEVEGAHTYFANGVLVHNCQSQADSVLRPLTERILPPALGDRLGTLVLAGTIPTVEAGLFWDLWQKSNWSKHNWSQFDNPFMPNAQRDLDEYLDKNPGLTIDSPIIQRERFGRFKFDKDATAYTYNAGLNGYAPVVPRWASELRVPSGAVMVAEPWAGADSFAFAIDPGANTDRVAVVGWAWSAKSREVQHVFDWASEKAKKHTWAEIAKVCSFASAHFPGIRWRYDAGSSQNTIDTFGRDYGIPLILAAKKSDLKGQVDRNNDLMTQGRAKVMIGSKLEEDYRKACWDIDARGRGQFRWAKAWHPDASEAARYALQDYFDLYEAPKVFVRRSADAIELEAVQAALERPEENESWMDNDLSRGRF